MIFGIARLIPHLRFRKKQIPLAKKNAIILIAGMAISNIPEALSIGVIFGALTEGVDTITLASCFFLALGIGILDIADSAANSLILREHGLTKKKSFIFAQLSGIVVPIVAPLGALLAASIGPFLPFIIGIASGALIYIAAQQIIPDAEKTTRQNLITLAILLGFILIMIVEMPVL